MTSSTVTRLLAALITVVLLSAALFSQIPPGYYDSVDTSTMASHRRTLHEVIDDHQRFPYTATTTDTWDILEEADQDADNTANIIDLYRNSSIVKQGGGNSFYHREHSWPKSYGFPNNVVSNYPYTDCHALFLCDGGTTAREATSPLPSATSPARRRAPRRTTVVVAARASTRASQTGPRALSPQARGKPG